MGVLGRNVGLGRNWCGERFLRVVIKVWYSSLRF